ncbi:MAG: transporter [Myxococcaceae bacterium]|nr:MAG: transporter [Myxococcaceae bacterium]
MPGIWLYVLAPIVVTMFGAVLTTVRVPSPRQQGALQHFAAGVVFAALGGEVLPDVMHRHAPAATVVGFVLGVAAMFGMRHWGERLESAPGRKTGLPVGIIVAVGIDALLDGLVIGVSFTAATKIGVLVTVALSLEMLFLGLTTALALRESGASAPKAVAITSGLALLIGVGAWLGLTLLRGLSAGTLGGVLSFGAATLLYLVTEELLHDAHKVPETNLVTSLFFAGFLLLFMIEMWIGG